MRFSARSKVGGLLSLIAFVTIISTFILNGSLFHATATHAAGGQSPSVTKGVLTPAGSNDVSSSTSTLLSRGVRHAQQKKYLASVSSSVASTQTGTMSNGTRLQNFNGPSS